MLANTFRYAALQQAKLTFRTSLRRYASRPPPPPPPPTAKPARTARAESVQHLRAPKNIEDAQRRKKINLAQDVLKAGGSEVLLYKAPRRVTIFRIQNYALLAITTSAVVYFRLSGLTDRHKLKERGLPLYVGVVYSIVTFVLTMVSILLIRRNQGRILRVFLVQSPTGPVIKLQHQTPVPFLSKTRTCPVGDLCFDRYQNIHSTRAPATIGAQSNAGILDRSTTGINQTFYNIFVAFQDFFSPSNVIKMFISQPGPPSSGFIATFREFFVYGLRLDLYGEFMVSEDLMMELSTPIE